ncbi:hypothetical protein [Mariniflexile sp.]|uniref:hypothetical protein n=1 Tax=Mariniflexile sp. TaxID=1979402 RepID=UPI0035692B80
MKNLLNNSKKGFLLVTMLVTMLSFAKEASVNSFMNDARKTSLTLNNVKQGDVFSIKDENGIVLYKELMQKSGIYTKGFDLTSLPNGEYFFELEKDMEIKTIPFIVNAKTVIVNRELESTTYKPYVKQKNNLLFISKLATNLKPVKISIYTHNNLEFQLLYSEKVEGVKTIEKVYKLEKGYYKVTINSDDKEFTTYINN